MTYNIYKVAKNTYHLLKNDIIIHNDISIKNNHFQIVKYVNYKKVAYTIENIDSIILETEYKLETHNLRKSEIMIEYYNHNFIQKMIPKIY